jgi:hypothetical protein
MYLVWSGIHIEQSAHEELPANEKACGWQACKASEA